VLASADANPSDGWVQAEFSLQGWHDVSCALCTADAVCGVDGRQRGASAVPAWHPTSDCLVLLSNRFSVTVRRPNHLLTVDRGTRIRHGQPDWLTADRPGGCIAGPRAACSGAVVGEKAGRLSLRGKVVWHSPRVVRSDAASCATAAKRLAIPRADAPRRTM
jgi:hypothetical protein